MTLIQRFGLLAVIAAVVTACQSGSWGPLAVIDEDARAVMASGGFPGTLRIGDRCVTLLLDDVARETTLVWRNSQASWDTSARQILFGAGRLRLSDGDRIAPGGAGIAEPGDPDQGAPQPTWLSAPDPSCPDEMFAVHSVIRLDP